MNVNAWAYLSVLQCVEAAACVCVKRTRFYRFYGSLCGALVSGGRFKWRVWTPIDSVVRQDQGR